MLRDFVDENSKSQLLSGFANKIITERRQNLNFNELDAFLNSFNQDWGERLRLKFNNVSKDAFSNINSDKNDVAHAPSKCAITFTEVCDNYEQSKAVVKFVAEILSSPISMKPWPNLINFFRSLPPI